jgi:hypothetical protein
LRSRMDSLAGDQRKSLLHTVLLQLIDKSPSARVIQQVIKIVDNMLRSSFAVDNDKVFSSNPIPFSYGLLSGHSRVPVPLHSAVNETPSQFGTSFLR